MGNGAPLFAIPAPPPAPQEHSLVGMAPNLLDIPEIAALAGIDGPMADEPLAGIPGAARRDDLEDLARSLSRLEQNSVPERVTPEAMLRGGVTFQPFNCDVGGVGDPCGFSKPLDVANNAEVVEARSMVVWTGDTCSAFGWESHNYVERARRLLLASESKRIARELWTGTLAQAEGWPNPYLASPDSDVLTSGAATPKAALACLEQGLADCGYGGRGMIHATPALVSHWTHDGVPISVVGDLLLTVHGNIVVPDAGYPGTSPEGADPTSGSQWAYGTGLVYVGRGPVDILPTRFEEALDRQLNTVAFRAERLAVAVWDGCCHVAVQVDVPLCLTGGVA